MTQYVSNGKIAQKQQEGEPKQYIKLERNEFPSQIIKHMNKEQVPKEPDQQENDENYRTASKSKQFVEEGESDRDSDGEKLDGQHFILLQIIKGLQQQLQKLTSENNAIKASSRAQLKRKQDEINRLKQRLRNQQNHYRIEEERPTEDNHANEREKLIKGLTVLIQKNQENKRQRQKHIRQLQQQRARKQEELKSSEKQIQNLKRILYQERYQSQEESKSSRQRIDELNSEKELYKMTLSHYQSQTQYLQAENLENYYKHQSQLNELERKHTSMTEKLSNRHIQMEERLKSAIETKEKSSQELEKLRKRLEVENKGLKRQRQEWINEIANLNYRLVEERLLRMETPKKEYPKRRRQVVRQKFRKNKDKRIQQACQRIIQQQKEMDSLSSSEEIG